MKKVWDQDVFSIQYFFESQKKLDFFGLGHVVAKVWDQLFGFPQMGKR